MRSAEQSLPPAAYRRVEIGGPPSRRPRLAVDPWRPRRVTAGFALGWVLTMGVLGTFTVIWLVGMVATTILLVVGQGGLGPVLAFVATGILLVRGWIGMVLAIRSRLRARDLEDPAALPAAFWSLSPGLQRLVRHTRSLEIVVCDPELPLAQLDREMFEWLSTMAELPPEDRRFLAERGQVPEHLRHELVRSRWLEDRARRHYLHGLLRRGAVAQWPRRTHATRALAVLEQLERDVLRTGGDPFRGASSRVSLPSPA